MTTIKAMRLASVVTAINVLVASGFSIVGIIHPQYLVPADPFQCCECAFARSRH